MECPTTNNQGSRFLCDVPQTSKNSPVFWLFFSVSAGLTVHRNFSRSSKDFFLCFYLVFLLKKKSSSAHWAFKSMDPSAKEKEIIIIITVMAILSEIERRRQVYYWLYSQMAVYNKNDEGVTPWWKRDVKILLGKQLPFCALYSYSWSCDVRKRGLGVWTSEIA